MFQKYQNGNWVAGFLAVTAGVSSAAAVAVWFFTRGSRLIVITDTQAVAEPTLGFFWPVIAVVVLATALCCALVGLALYTVFQRRLQKPSMHLQDDLNRLAVGDFSRPVEFWSAQDVYDVAFDLEKTREALQLRIKAVRDRYNAVKNFLDHKNFEVNAQNREALQQKLKDVDELLKEFKLVTQTMTASKPVAEPAPEIKIMAPQPRADKVVKDAEEMLKS